MLIAGRYTLHDEVGRGGMGAVWRGTDELLGRPVAVKRVGYAPQGPADQAPDAVRAEREARLAAMINHPHVVAVYDLVTEHDQQWLVMEFVEGTALSALLDAEGPLSPERAARLLAQAADALRAAHEAGVVHRDVKPSNLLVSSSDELKISDFGIARGESDVALTRTGMVTGSPAYLAPEVASGSSATVASDVWSLGATLYHAVTGHAPYAVGDNVLGTLYRIVNEDPPRLERGERLAPLLEHTMATDVAARWSMGEVRDYLRGGAAPRTNSGGAAPVAGDGTEHAGLAGSVLPFTHHADEPHRPRRSGARTRRAARPDRHRLLPLLAVGLAVVLVAMVALGLGLLTGSDDDGADETAPVDPPSASPSAPDDSPSPTPTPSPSPSASPEADTMTSFVQSYLATVTSDPAAAWERLTPGFQEQSGGFEQYRDFWSSYDSASASGIEADPEALTVSYSVSYVLDDGSGQDDQVTLELAFDDGDYLIAGEP